MKTIATGEGLSLEAETRDGIPPTVPVGEEFVAQVAAFVQTEGQHQRSYRELAK